MLKIKLYNHELKPLIEFLYKLKLVDQKSRMRSRFIRLLGEKYQLFQEEHMQLIKEYSNLDENGEPKIVEKDGRKQYDVNDIESFNKAYIELLNEEIIIEQNKERKKMLLTVKDVVLNCGIEFEGEEAIDYDRFCEIVEQIDYEEES